MCVLLGTLFLVLSLLPIFANAQTNASLPVAITVPVFGADATGGQIVTFSTQTRTYSLSQNLDDASVYGVTVSAPPLLFATATNTTPVVTSGSAYVRFSTDTGAINRGDLLISSAQTGVAQRAATENEHVFAIALEDSSVSTNGQILVHIDPVLAKAKHQERIEVEALAAEAAAAGIGGEGEATAEEEKGVIQKIFEQYSRVAIATIIAVGSLFFVMYTFRSTIVNATLAVGRNPRARNAIMTVSIENIIFALIICAVAIFVALAVLVLPV